MKIPDCVTRRNIFLTVVLIVAFIILLTTVYETKHYRLRLFSFWKQSQPRRVSQVCKSISKRDNVNWNYFYYYEDLATKKSLVWCKVPKAGSTTLTKMFLRLAGAKNLQNNTRIHKLLRDFYPRQSPNSMKQRMKFSKTFLVVRDPFERILSAYRDKLENYSRDLQFRDGYYYDHYGRFMVKNDNVSSTNTTRKPTRKEPTWSEFVSYLLKTPISRYDEHWMPVTRLCSPCTVSYDVVIKLENFGSEIRKPLEHAGINMSNLGRSHTTGTAANKKMVSSYFKNLTLADVKKLYAKYKLDFQLFGYTPFKYYKLFNNNESSKKSSTNI